VSQSAVTIDLNNLDQYLTYLSLNMNGWIFWFLFAVEGNWFCFAQVGGSIICLCLSRRLDIGLGTLFWDYSVYQIILSTVGTTVINLSDQVRDLGVTLDSKLTFRPHINNVCRTSSFAIRNIGRVRKYLSKDQLEKLIHSFVSSRLDYCNSLLYGLPACDMDKLQRIQNTAARLLAGAKRTDSASAILKKLHWLPIRERIEFKILLMTYKTQTGSAPSYISELLHKYVPVRTLRSSTKSLLQVPSTKTITYGQRAFSSAGPRLWNSLPESLKTKNTIGSFKASLKTYLFTKVFQ